MKTKSNMTKDKEKKIKYKYEVTNGKLWKCLNFSGGINSIGYTLLKDKPIFKDDSNLQILKPRKTGRFYNYKCRTCGVIFKREPFGYKGYSATCDKCFDLLIKETHQL